MMKSYRSFMLLLLVVLLAVPFSACTGSDNESVEGKAWQEIRSGAMLLDVRTPEEFAGGHLENALNIPYDQITSRSAELGEDKNKMIVVYCRSGKRAGAAEKTLKSLGFTNVLNAGGYDSMRAAQ